MRYVHKHGRGALIAVDGTVLWQGNTKLIWEDNFLVVGSTTTNVGAGNAIVPDFTNTVNSKKYQTLYPAGATDLEKVGLGIDFWEAPTLLQADAVVAGVWYKVLTGTVTNNNITYGKGARFKAVGTSFTGTGSICRDVPEEWYKPDEHNMRSEAFKLNNLERGDESSWNEQTWGSNQPAFGWTR